LARKPIAAAAGAVYQLALKAIGVQGGQTVEAASYRVIEGRRPGMTYVAASGSVGGPLTFTPEQNGTFTRNVLQEGGQLWAEIK
jgi:DNA-binding transcriptional regulator LsrR (DeoR family)